MSVDFVYEFSPFTIEAGKVREFAKALGFENPVYEEISAAKGKGLPNIPVPPTFSAVIDYWNKRDLYLMFEQLGLKPEDVLHGEQAFEYKSRMFVGDVIYAKTKLLKKIEKKGKNFYFLQTIYNNQFDEVLLISHATLIEIVEVAT